MEIFGATQVVEVHCACGVSQCGLSSWAMQDVVAASAKFLVSPHPDATTPDMETCTCPALSKCLLRAITLQ